VLGFQVSAQIAGKIDLPINSAVGSLTRCNRIECWLGERLMQPKKCLAVGETENQTPAFKKFAEPFVVNVEPITVYFTEAG
jgi:hypothetical protein